MKKFKEHVIYYYYSYLLALLFILYGWQLTVHPDILQTYKVYQRLRDVSQQLLACPSETYKTWN